MQKVILVTGGAGFIGSHLCERLVKDGHRVISLDNYFTGSRENHVEGVEYREGHTKDIATLVPETPDLIYHLGEYSRVEQSVHEPAIVYELNTLGTSGVIEYWRNRRSKLVYAGSSTKFGNEDWNKSAVPYVVTKAANTERIREMGDTEKLPYAIAYFYNVYGPGERAGMYGTVIEAFKSMHTAGMPLTVTSPGTQRRNFTHVDDIVDGLVLVGEHGQGDAFELGSGKSFSILEVAGLFGGDVVMLPPRSASRMFSSLDTSRVRELGWEPKHTLETYIGDFMASSAPVVPHAKRVLVFSTTFYPIAGPAEEALIHLISKMPDITFDIITARFARGAEGNIPGVPNAVVHRVGIGFPMDKFFLPVLGFVKARSLYAKHRYLFAWSLMASYAAGAALFFKGTTRVPVLITLADQQIDTLSITTRFLLALILGSADQVYGIHATQESSAVRISKAPLPRTHIGEGDAFANQLRYAYGGILRGI